MKKELVAGRRPPNVCPRCGLTNLRAHYKSDAVDFKGLTLDVDGLAETICGDCDYHWNTDGQDLDNMAILRSEFARVRDEMREEDGLLTGEQIDKALHLLSISRAKAALLFGGGPNAFARYSSGDVLQSVAMDRLIRLTVAFGGDAIAFLQRASTELLVLNAGTRNSTVISIRAPNERASVRKASATASAVAVAMQ